MGRSLRLSRFCPLSRNPATEAHASPKRLRRASPSPSSLDTCLSQKPSPAFNLSSRRQEIIWKSGKQEGNGPCLLSFPDVPDFLIQPIWSSFDFDSDFDSPRAQLKTQNPKLKTSPLAGFPRNNARPSLIHMAARMSTQSGVILCVPRLRIRLISDFSWGSLIGCGVPARRRHRALARKDIL